MDNFTIYRNGQYSVIDNAKLKINNKLPVITAAVDDFFTNH